VSRILLAGGGTGGHLMPALALADALRALRPDVEPVLVGAERGVEATILPNRPYRFHLLPAEPLYRRSWWRNARWPLLLPRLWRAARRVLDAERPGLVVGTGGYASAPVLVAARLRGIPLALQEQNALPGVATRWLARWARQVHLGFPEAEGRLRVGRRTAVHALGNPIVPPPARDRAAARRALGLPADGPVVLVTGGSQGSRAINRAVAGALEEGLLGGVALLWSAGAGTFEEFRGFHRPPDVQVRPFWDPIAEAYAAADLVVARAGAMTTAELAAWGLPALLIPLPTAAGDHQSANARALEAAGAAVHLPESRLSAAGLAQTVTALLADPSHLSAMTGAATRRGRPDAARAIAERLLGLLDDPR
jgi:UDP-N-acetylglucosamine--N-acetylmuramyl-(pentapeptide) pyrophosphoryl-undecaprenol N-acetylglucosamine transferase